MSLYTLLALSVLAPLLAELLLEVADGETLLRSLRILGFLLLRHYRRKKLRRDDEENDQTR